MADDGSKKRLGRGLAALIGEMDKPIEKVTVKPKTVKSATSDADSVELKIDRQVPIELIRQNPNNPRKYFVDEQLGDLASSIAEHGIVQPILVRSIKGEDLGGAKYEIIAGERRWRAAQMAKLHDVPIIIREVEDKQALELAIIENVQRADLNPVEEAMGYQQLIDEYDYTQSDLGTVIGKSRSHVANTLRLLKLPSTVKKMVSDGTISAGHARALITSTDAKSLAIRIEKEGLSVRQIELLVQKQNEPENKNKTGAPETKSMDFKSADIKALEQQLEDVLGLKIDIRNQKNNSGEMRIKYKNLDQLDDVCRRLSK